MSYQFHSVYLFLLLLNLPSSSTIQQVSAKLVLEEGYTVTTILDGNKLSTHINPSSVVPRFGKTHDGDLFILDTPASTFYRVKFPITQESEITRVSGNGTAGFSDGDLVSAMFDRPRSFAVDFKGNVYVADKNNHAIRKISKEGVATIAGGYSGKPGKADGPAQHASFSEDFELVFVPELCALLISDRGNRLVRQMSLKPDDCATGSQSGLGSTGVSLVVVCCLLLGSVIGFAANHFLVSREVSSNHRLNVMWKRCLINLGRQVQIVCSDIKSAVVSSTPYPLMVKLVRMIISHLSLMFRIPIVEKQNLYRNPVSLLDSNDVGVGNFEVPKAEEMFVDQLKDLISFDGDHDESNKAVTHRDDDHERSDILKCSNQRIEGMILSNIMNFESDVQASQRNQADGSLRGSSGLVKRK